MDVQQREDSSSSSSLPSAPKRFLVVDSSALIRCPRFERFEAELYTVPEVISEIRDQRTRDFLRTYNYSFKQVHPSSSAVDLVKKFAEKTGDLPVLSEVDIKLLALTYELEVQQNGTSSLRTEPKAPRDKAASASPSTSTTTTPPPSSSSSSSASASVAQSSAQEADEKPPKSPQEDSSSVDSALRSSPSRQQQPKESNAQPEPRPQPQLKSSLPPPLPSSSTSTSTSTSPSTSTSTSSSTSIRRNETIAATTEVGGKVEEEGGWITADNYRDHLLKDNSKVDAVPLSEAVKVCCLTTDFPMQNVCLQMGLQLLSCDGLLVRKVKNYIFRCHACFWTTQDMSKVFCGACGQHNTLLRIPYWINANGDPVYGEFPKVSLRGIRYNVRVPKGGKDRGLCLTEDEYMRRQRMIKKKKKKTQDPFDPDYDFFERRPQEKTVKVGHSNKNPNQTKRRRKPK